MPSVASSPSVLAPPSFDTSPPSMETFGTSTLPEGSDASSRRQRITMACQYCRHRKIRCCGGSPCRNCARSQRECEYAPVPEEVNRATREKKAMAKAAKSHSVSGSITPASGCSPAASSAPYYYPNPSPYFTDTPVFEGPYMAGPHPTSSPMNSRPSDFAHRRSFSVPNFELQSWAEGTPSAPQLHSPAMFESPQWMQHGGWSPSTHLSPASSPYPSVLERPMRHLAIHTGTNTSANSTPGSTSSYIPGKVEEMPPLPAAWSASQSMSHSTPVSPVYYTPQPTPGGPYHTNTQGQSPYFAQPAYSRHHSAAVINLNADSSPTLAPEMDSSSSGKELVGLGLGVPAARYDPYGPAHTLSEEYFAAQAGY
ncbi:hypothetical protein BD324DRAFT_511567 [Kockovaella imperatae]|uniref:Zn(2)-C6 fungal-type domain-containing protein n=1 Tax=Kockovaella imperatae TaxID=4999 RepID=A0A1Y1UD57_9TREE|nr:hypothetical protein BD324DRAFT_511567 [Kockovaella imperatae]ORX35919.1 hypothetical protein BD324DRAFT_511567 [Kockovaella imperatae]